MKIPSGAFALKFGILATSLTASIILISACWEKSFIEKPVLIIMSSPGVKTTKNPDEVQAACRALNESGKGVCEIAFYTDGREVFHEGKVTMTRAVQPETGGTPASASRNSVIQKVAFDTLDDATDFLSKIK